MNHKLKNERIRRRLVSILSCIVVFCTTYALILPAVTLERDDIVYYCGKEEHQHTDECYESPKDRPLCGLKDGEMVDGHVHDESCYKTEMVLDCLEDHEHTDECYKEEKTLVCDKEEGAQEHKHSSKCFLSTEPLCGKEVHTHSRECESNKSLKETKEDWEHSIPAKLKDTAAERMVQIALSQKDYKEVKENFELNEEGHEQYYTRYGEWYGRPYEDWNVMFVSFVLRYAGIKNEQIPYGHDWNEWIEDLTKKQLFADEGYMPKDGDLIFIKDKEDENVPDKEIRNYAGIVTDIENRKIVVGDLNGQVKEITLDDKEYETNAYVAMIESDAKDDVPADKEESNDNETNKEERPDEEAEEEVKEEETDPIEFRMPEQFEIENEDFTLTLTPRVFDEDVQEENQEQTEEDSEETNEEGLKIKKFSLNEENIQDKIDAENELTKEELEQIAQANEEQKKEDEDKPLLTVQLEKIDEQAQTSEEQAEIEQLKEQSLENVDQDNLLDLSFYKLRFFANDQEVDLKDQKFDAELTPTQKFVDECDVKDEFPDAAPEAEVGYYLQVVQPGTQVPSSLMDNRIESEIQNATALSNLNTLIQSTSSQNENSILIDKEYNNKPLNFVMRANQTTSLIREKSPNPSFKVQIYGRLYKNKQADEEDYKLSTLDRQKQTFQVIDMSNGIPDKFSESSLIFNDYKKGTEGEFKDKFVQYLSTEPEVLYSSTIYHYHQAPNIKYFNKLDGISSYKPEKIWILKNGRNEESTNRDDWYEFLDWNDLHFTNYANHDDLYNESTNPDGKYYLISNDTVIRLIFTEVKADTSSPTTFWDYDFFDENGNVKLGDKNVGINSQDNYSKKYDSTLIFGNNYISEPLGYGNNKINDTENINQTAGDFKGNIPKTYKDSEGNEITTTVERTLKSHPVFGIVGNKLDEIQTVDPNTGEKTSSRRIHYNVNAPNLFFDGTAIGKTEPLKGSLSFHRTGDTYRLYGVTGPNNYEKNTLDTFGYIPTWDNFTNFHFNGFWPLDNYDINKNHGGTTRKKMYISDKNGSNQKEIKLYGTDDGKDHNMVFGMRYDVNFNLDENYKGPLDYFFFGDDDMWVFLDGYLICDLGGVHQTLGAEVKIRDAYKKATGVDLPSGEHTLTVYYLERGQSGSSCYIEYTLPEVSHDIPENKTGELTIEKQTNNSDLSKDYTFEIELSDNNNNELLDDYALTVYEKNNQGNIIIDPERSDITYRSKGKIKLKKGQYAVIKYLPLGTKYVIREILSDDDKSDTFVSACDYIGCNVPQGEIPTDGIYSIDGEISENNITKYIYIYNNKTYQLPETGSLGIDPPLIAGSAGVMTTSFYALTLKRKGRWRKRKR